MNKKLVLFLAIYLLIEIPFLFTSFPADENVYYYMAKEVSQGREPYTDFFYGHPPMQLYIYSALIGVFGFHVWVLKLFTIFVSMGCGVFVYLIAKERYGGSAGYWALFIFLSSYDLIVFGSFAFGLEIAIFFFLAALYFLEKDSLVSGILFAFCIMTRLHFAFLGVVLFLYAKRKWRFLLGCSVASLYYIPLLFVPNFLGSVVGYHMAKLNVFSGWVNYFRSNLVLFTLLAFGIKKLKDAKLIFIGIVYCLFLLLVKSIFEYYFFIITALLAIEGSVALVKSKYKNVLKFVVLFWIATVIWQVVPFAIENTTGYNEMIDYVDALPDKPIIGQSAVTALIALKTDRNISKLQIDTNFQRKEVYDYSNAIVIYESYFFHNDKGYNCSNLMTKKIRKEVYEVWDCGNRTMAGNNT